MTDDESRKAFEAWEFAFSSDGKLPPLGYETWQAAVEFATKRERERCVALCRDVAKEPCLYWAMPLTMTDREAIAEECALMIEQEPKP